MEVEIALFILDLKNFRQSISRSDNSFVDVPPARENASNKMLAIFYRTASERLKSFDADTQYTLECIARLHKKLYR
jgi:hypothetical protein